MTSEWVEYHCKIVGNMNSDLYTKTLNDVLLSTIDYYGLEKDNNPKHTSRLAQEWFQTNRINVITYPSQSPDLSFIGHL